MHSHHVPLHGQGDPLGAHRGLVLVVVELLGEGLDAAVQLVEDIALPPGRAVVVNQLVEEHAVQEPREEVASVLDRDIGAPETEEGRLVEADDGF